ncbi:MAG: hypothetical protein ACYCQK_01870 [Acidiferrobacteraceae bacterium]
MARDEAVQRLDAFWVAERDADAREIRDSVHLRDIARAHATHAQIAALIYVGDEIRQLREMIDRAIGAWEYRR